MLLTLVRRGLLFKEIGLALVLSIDKLLKTDSFWAVLWHSLLLQCTERFDQFCVFTAPNRVRMYFEPQQGPLPTYAQMHHS